MWRSPSFMLYAGSSSALVFPQIGLCFVVVPKGSVGGGCGRRRISRRPGFTNHWVGRASSHMHVAGHVANSAFCNLGSSLFHRVEQLLHVEAHPSLPSCMGSWWRYISVFEFIASQ